MERDTGGVYVADMKTIPSTPHHVNLTVKDLGMVSQY